MARSCWAFFLRQCSNRRVRLWKQGPAQYFGRIGSHHIPHEYLAKQHIANWQSGVDLGSKGVLISTIKSLE